MISLYIINCVEILIIGILIYFIYTTMSYLVKDMIDIKVNIDILKKYQSQKIVDALIEAGFKPGDRISAEEFARIFKKLKEE